MNMTLFFHRLFKTPSGKPPLYGLLVLAAGLCFGALLDGTRLIALHTLLSLLYAAAVYRLFASGRITAVRRALFAVPASVFLLLCGGIAAGIVRLSPLACPVGAAASFSRPLMTLSNGPFALELILPAVVLLAAVIATGRMWCSWACWLGSFDDTAAACAPRPTGIPSRITEYFSELPAAMLIVSLLATIAGGAAFFCAVACPFLPLSSSCAAGIHGIWSIGGVIILLAAVVILPLVTGRRVFCRFICPLNGLLRMARQIHPAHVRIDAAACTRCGKCRAVCPMSAIDETYAVSPYCTHCLACYEICPEHAVLTQPAPSLMLVLAPLAGLWCAQAMISLILRGVIS